MSSPDFWNDQTAARALIEKKNALEAVTGPYEKLVAHQEELELMADLLKEAGHEAEDQPDVLELGKQVAALEKQYDHVELQSLMIGASTRTTPS